MGRDAAQTSLPAASLPSLKAANGKKAPPGAFWRCRSAPPGHRRHTPPRPAGECWFDEKAAIWRDRRGRPARWPDLVEATRFRMTRVVLAAAHLDSDPTNNRVKNLRALCQRCHMLHDRPHHLAQRWITYRRRSAVGDLFLGPYPALIAALTLRTTATPSQDRRAGRRGRRAGGLDICHKGERLN